MTQPSTPGLVEPRTKRGLPWMLLLSMTLAAMFLYLAIRGVDWAAFEQTLRNGHYELLALTVPIMTMNYFIRALRWSVLVRTEEKVSVLSVFWANMVGYMGNAYLPARAGEVLRSSFLGQKTGSGISFVLATALTERLLDVVALVLIGATALLVQVEMSPLLANALRALALAGFVGLAVVIVAPFYRKRILLIAGQLALPRRVSRGMSEQITRFLDGMQSLRNGRRLTSFIALTFAIWLVDAVTNVIGVRIISQTLTIGQALIFLAALGLSSAIPSTPGSVGVYQFVAVLVLVPFGFSRADALAYILVAQVLSYILVTFWGLLGLWQMNKVVRGRTNPEPWD